MSDEQKTADLAGGGESTARTVDAIHDMSLSDLDLELLLELLDKWESAALFESMIDTIKGAGIDPAELRSMDLNQSSKMMEKAFRAVSIRKNRSAFIRTKLLLIQQRQTAAGM